MKFFHEVDFSNENVSKFILYNPISCMKPVLIDYDLDKICSELNISQEKFSLLEQNQRRNYIYSHILDNIKSDICKNINIPNVKIENIKLKICTYYKNCKNCSRGNYFTMPLIFKDKTTKIFKFCYHIATDIINVSFCSIDGEVKNLPSKNGKQNVIFKSFYPAKINENKNSLASSFPKGIIDEKDNYILRYIPDESKIFNTKLDFENNKDDFPVTINISESCDTVKKWNPKEKVKPITPIITPIMIRSESSISNGSQQSIIERNLSSVTSSPRLDDLEQKFKDEFPSLELEENSNPLFKLAVRFSFDAFKELDSKYQKERDKVQILEINQGIVEHEKDKIIQENDLLKKKLSLFKKEYPFFNFDNDINENLDNDSENNSNISDDENNSLDY